MSKPEKEELAQCERCGSTGSIWVEPVLTGHGPTGESRACPDCCPWWYVKDLRSAQTEVVANRRRRGFASATDLSKTTCGLAEEVGEFERARKSGNRLAMLDALADIAVFCLGGFEIMGVDAESSIIDVIKKNATRKHSGEH